jgi:hypothetical protein
VGRSARPIPTAGLVAGLLLPGALAAAVPQSPDLWGRVTLIDGAVLEGFIRWDRNETTVADMLDGSRSPSEDGTRLRRTFSERTAEERRRSVELPGLRVTWEEDEEFDALVRSGVRFGHIERIVPDGSRIRVDLRGGGSVELRASSTDIGSAFRGLEVEVEAGDIREVGWPRIAEIGFMPVPEGRSPSRARLYGTVATDRGLEFTGWLAWDADEVFASDLLDGEEGSLAFSEIRMVERAGRGVRVSLGTGEQMTLTGTNDVDDGNRGIHVSDPGLGRVVVEWDAFTSLRFEPSVPTAGEFGTAGPIRGSVETESGREFAGRIVWDLDESERWHLLNGDADGVSIDVEFSRIRRIEKARGGDGVVVTLRDGRTVELEGSNDVDAMNRGIVVIMDSGEETLVEWAGFRSLTLETSR